MLGLAKAHPVLISWLAAGLLGALLGVAGPALVVVTADAMLPGDGRGAGVAEALHVLLLMFHASLLVAGTLTIRLALRRLRGR